MADDQERQCQCGPIESALRTGSSERSVLSMAGTLRQLDQSRVAIVGCLFRRGVCGSGLFWRHDARRSPVRFELGGVGRFGQDRARMAHHVVGQFCDASMGLSQLRDTRQQPQQRPHWVACRWRGVAQQSSRCPRLRATRAPLVGVRSGVADDSCVHAAWSRHQGVLAISEPSRDFQIARKISTDPGLGAEPNEPVGEVPRNRHRIEGSTAAASRPQIFFS
jgi:hypothetical protein